jgi:hypothetical protein
LLSRLAEANALHVCPNGTVFVKKDVRQGVLPVMLDEILRTRVMVKRGMKHEVPGEATHRLMNARQMGLKLIANVTYGYTSASFSGRMPCVDIADSIVQQARETLTKAMRMVENNPEWQAKVGSICSSPRPDSHLRACLLRSCLLIPSSPAAVGCVRGHGQHVCALAGGFQGAGLRGGEGDCQSGNAGQPSAGAAEV